MKQTFLPSLGRTSSEEVSSKYLTVQLSAVRAQPRLGDEAGQLRGTVLSYFLENIQAEALSVIQ